MILVVGMKNTINFRCYYLTNTIIVTMMIRWTRPPIIIISVLKYLIIDLLTISSEITIDFNIL